MNIYQIFGNPIKEDDSIFQNSTISTKNDTIKKPKEFCLYNSEGMIKLYDPIYRNKEGKLVHAETIEEYAKILGPTWYGVSFCNNNTLVNSLGLYFDRTKSKSKLNKRSEEGNTADNIIMLTFFMVKIHY